MRYAIVESGGKQYRAVEGGTIEVDRLPAAKGDRVALERILFLSDGDEVLIGTPTLSGIQVKATVLDHIRGEKVVTYKYRPKKRIRVKGGHRQQFTRLMVDFIGKPGEVRKAEEAEPRADKPKPAAEKPAEAPAKEKRTAAPKSGKAPARKPAAKSGSGKKPTK